MDIHILVSRYPNIERHAMNDLLAFAYQLFPGAIAFLVIYGMFIVDVRPASALDKLRDQHTALGKKYRHVFGQYRLAEDASVFLQESLERAEARYKEAQLTQEKLDGEIARLEKKLRSKEFELHEERSRKKGSRK